MNLYDQTKSTELEHTTTCITFHPNNLVHLRLVNIRRVPKRVQFAGCCLDLAI